STIKIRHQLCVFHQLMNVRKVLEELYSEKTRKRLNAEGKMWMHEIVNIFRSEDREEAWNKLEKLYAREEIPWKLRKELEKMGERFENLTWYLEDGRVPMTNNRIELYYRITQPQRTKKRFKTKEGLEGILRYQRARKKNGSTILLTMGMLCLNLWQALGFIATIL
ncbi:MAG: hypothetical protein QW115_06790, partial [Thermoplasmata archaeon]